MQDIAAQIQTGAIEIGLAVGAEHMSTGGDRLTRPFVDDIVNANQHAADCLQPMGQTSENVGKDFNITREQQDRYAAESYRRAEAAQKAGWFEDEITPITVKVKDPKTGEEKEVTLTKDEGPRWGTTFEGLNKIRPAFPDFGDRSTGGNSSQVTDGAAAVLLMKRSKALELGQPILAKFVGATVAGLAPRIMGIGPSVAVPKLLTKYGLDIKDIDLVELNEAFASMAVYCKDVLKIDHSKLNVRGGAIALVSSTRHPFLTNNLSPYEHALTCLPNRATPSAAPVRAKSSQASASADAARPRSCSPPCASARAWAWLVCSSTSRCKRLEIAEEQKQNQRRKKKKRKPPPHPSQNSESNVDLMYRKVRETHSCMHILHILLRIVCTRHQRRRENTARRHFQSECSPVSSFSLLSPFPITRC